MSAQKSIEARVARLEAKERERSLDRRVAELRADGYTEGHHNPIDARVVRESKCEECDKRTLRYFGVLNPSPWSYVAVAVCKSCGWWAEI